MRVLLCVRVLDLVFPPRSGNPRLLMSSVGCGGGSETNILIFHFICYVNIPGPATASND